ncbi:CD276 antigen isoform X2 [Pleuronectes platessa]|uniref:CD276 antigen isoform X2 n=1 Tax=Pleuronectes platessa TaxID=8262 RepID=UPI00232A3F12|nr:CD276 antigen isoform X2 [Pleuronectes platessa]
MKLHLLVSFLSLWRRSDGTGAAPIKVLVKKGDDVILPCSFSSENIRQELFDWNKDKKGVFMYDKGKVYNDGDSRQDEQFRGRVFHFPEHLHEGNASIVIRATKLTDSGNYTCLFPLLVPERRSNIELVVGAAPKPSVTILDGTTVWALLMCEVLGAFPKPDVQWQNRAGDIVPAEEPQVSERGGRYDIILQTTVNKTDLYRCVSTQEELNHQTHAEIFVLLNRAAPEPHIKILGETKEGVQLQCSVRGASPKPKVHWQNGAGDIVPAEEPQVSERGGRYDIILQTTVTKTDHYRCVSTQEENETRAETYVPVPGAAPEPHIKILGETKEGVQLQCSVRGASPKPKVYLLDGDGDIVPAEEPQVTERGGRYDIILQTTVTKTDHYSCVSTQEENETRAETYVPVPGAAPEPHIKILGETKEGVQLQCSVLGAFPKPDVQWQNRAGDIVPAEEPQVSERGGRYDIILQTTVTKTDHYHCVSTQEEINHQTHAEIFVLLNGAAPEPHIKILGETKEGVQLQCSVRGASPKPKVYLLDGDGDIVPAEEPQVTEREGGRYDIILQTTVTKTDFYRCVSTQEENETRAETYVPVPDAGGTVPLWGAGVAAVVAVLLTLLGVLLYKYCVCKKKTPTAEPPEENQATAMTPLRSQDQTDMDPSL